MWITWRHPCCKPGLKRLTGINCCEWPTDLHRSGIEKVGVIDDNGNSCRIPGLLIFLLWTPRMEFFHLSGNPRVRRLKNVWLAPWHCYWFWCFDSIDLVSILTTSCFSISSLSPKRPIKCCLAQSSYMQYNKRKCPHGDEKYPHLTPPPSFHVFPSLLALQSPQKLGSSDQHSSFSFSSSFSSSSSSSTFPYSLFIGQLIISPSLYVLVCACASFTASSGLIIPLKKRERDRPRS